MYGGCGFEQNLLFLTEKYVGQANALIDVHDQGTRRE